MLWEVIKAAVVSLVIVYLSHRIYSYVFDNEEPRVSALLRRPKKQGQAQQVQSQQGQVQQGQAQQGQAQQVQAQQGQVQQAQAQQGQVQQGQVQQGQVQQGQAQQVQAQQGQVQQGQVQQVQAQEQALSSVDVDVDTTTGMQAELLSFLAEGRSGGSVQTKELGATSLDDLPIENEHDKTS
jgi:hypothetical protein